MNHFKIPLSMIRPVVCCLLAAGGVGCAQSQFRNDNEFASAVRASKVVVGRLSQMPIEDLGKLAFSKQLQKEWADREDEVFAGTPYLGASIMHSDSFVSTSRHRWSPEKGTLLSIGPGRRAFDGYLRRGKARTPEYSGPTYVYHIRDGWTDLLIHIAATEVRAPDG